MTTGDSAVGSSFLSKVPKGRLFAIGDIHGCSQELATLIEKMNPKPNDTLVFLGDYIDRGGDSRGVIDIVIGLRSRCRVVALKGNHESMFVDFLDHPESSGAGLFILNGGGTTLANYTTADGGLEIPEDHVEFLKHLELYHEEEGFFFVHAGVPEIPLKDLTPALHETAFLWSRFPFLQSEYKWEKVIVHGHTPVGQADFTPNRINIDTGCVYKGMLTAVELPSLELIQVPRMDDPKKEIETVYSVPRISRRYSGKLPVEASRQHERPRFYETLNYNQFGLLMRDPSQSPSYLLKVGDKISGTIGDELEKMVRFTGTVARCEARSGTVVYGVAIDRISADAGVPNWIQRPKS
jgi:serine/threonine protein phosphatase 1